MARPQILYRLTWDHGQGVYWLPMRVCDDSTAEAWLDLFQRDEPGVTYCLARKPPKVAPDDRARARHVAMFH